MIFDGINAITPAVAVAISLASLYFARKSWERSNRPLVTAFVEENGEGVAFDLKVSNTGNRPALNVKFEVEEEALSTLLEEDANEQHKQAVYSCFSPASSIPLLRNGETLSTALGAYNRNNPWLNYGAEAQIGIKYSDLEGKKYHSRILLKVYVREGFGGSVWRRST